MAETSVWIGGESISVITQSSLGIYIARMATSQYTKSIKMVLLK